MTHYLSDSHTSEAKLILSILLESLVRTISELFLNEGGWVVRSSLYCSDLQPQTPNPKP